MDTAEWHPHGMNRPIQGSSACVVSERDMQRGFFPACLYNAGPCAMVRSEAATIYVTVLFVSN